MDLKNTTRAFIKRIKEYNDIVTLKHLKQNSVPSKGLKRYPGDGGKITNYHFVLNWDNLAPVFQELSGQSQSTKKTSAIIRRTKELSTLDTRHQVSKSTMQTQIQTSSIQTSRKTSLQPFTQRAQSIKRPTTLTVKYQPQSLQSSPTTAQYKEPFSLVKELISKSFHEYEHVQKKVIEEVDEKTPKLSEKKLTTHSSDPGVRYIKDYIQANQDNRYRQCSVDVDARKRILHRKAIIANVNKRKAPKFVHLSGSKFTILNTPENLKAYHSSKKQALVQLLEEELERLKTQKDEVDLKTLEGPPIKVDYHSSSLRQDYDDVKVSSIMKKMIALIDKE